MPQIIYTDGASAKSINPWDLDDRPEAWTWLSNAPEREIENMFYKVAASFRAVNIRAQAAANVPFQILRGGEVIAESSSWQDRPSELLFFKKPRDLMRRISMSITFTNAAYLLMGQNIAGRNKQLRFLVPTTITPIVKAVGGEIDYFQRSVNGLLEKIALDDPKLIKIWLLDHTTELLPSKHTAINSIFNSTSGIYFQDLFVSNFYQRGGVKPHVIALKGAIFNEKKEDIERGWSKFLRNLSRFSSKIMNAETMDVKDIGSGVDDLKNNEIYRQEIENIALGIGMPVSRLLSDWDSFATAEVDDMAWHRDDVFPHIEMIAEEMNEQIFEPLDMRLDPLTEQSNAETEDEIERADAIGRYLDILLKCPSYEIFEGVMNNNGAEIGDVLEKAAKNYFKEKDQKAQEQQAITLQQNQPSQPVQELTPVAPEPPAKSLWVPSLNEYKELDIWRAVALRRNKKSESMEFDYQPHYGGLPDELSAKIKVALLAATSQEAIKDAFEIRYEVETVTPTTEYKTSELILLADALNNVASKTLEPITINTIKKVSGSEFMDVFLKRINTKGAGNADNQPN